MRAASRLAPPSSLRRAVTMATWMGFVALPEKRANILRNMRVVLTGSPELGSGEVERKRAGWRSSRWQAMGTFWWISSHCPYRAARA